MQGSRAHALLLAIFWIANIHPPSVAGDRPELAVERALREVRALKGEEALAESAERIQSILDRATLALESGHPEYALALTIAPLDLAEAFLFRAEHTKSVEDQDAFQAVWVKDESILNAALSGIKNGVCPQATSQIRALAERGLNQAALYYRAAAPTSRASGVGSGLFYQGRARGNLHLQRFCENSTTELSPPGIRITLEMIREIEKQTVDEFSKSSRGVEQHGRFISINALIKELRELERAGLRFGTLDTYLDARRTLAELRDSPAAATELQPLLERASAQLEDSAQDDSIVAAMIQQASALLAVAEPDENSLRVASAILRDAVPSYFTLLHTESK